MPTRRERIEGGLLGLLVGDALGVPYEFRSPTEIPKLDLIEMSPPEGMRRSHQVPPGTWSDDGAQALALASSLLDQGVLDPDDLGFRLLDWLHQGAYAPDRYVFDVGIQTSEALADLKRGVPADRSGPTGEDRNGKGSLMRVLPLALWHQGTDQELVNDAFRQSIVTHGHPRSQVCCGIYCLWARNILEKSRNPWETAVAEFRELYPIGSIHREELEGAIRPDDPPQGKGSGYVVDCLRSARLATAAGSYERVVKSAIALGNDTDTTACVAGGIAGIRDGVEAIPTRWLDLLRGKEIVAPILKGLVERSASA